MLSFLDNATLMQKFRSDLLISIEVLIERSQTNLQPLLLKDVGKTALWQTPVQGHLSALKSNLARIARTRLLPLLTSAGSFAQA
jgi:hypothetical protein